MSRNSYKLPDGNILWWGFDNPSEGFYAYEENSDEEFISGIGMVYGVSIMEVKAWMEQYDFHLTQRDIDALKQQRAREEKPLTALQQKMKAFKREIFGDS